MMATLQAVSHWLTCSVFLYVSDASPEAFCALACGRSHSAGRWHIVG